MIDDDAAAAGVEATAADVLADVLGLAVAAAAVFHAVTGVVELPAAAESAAVNAVTVQVLAVCV